MSSSVEPSPSPVEGPTPARRLSPRVGATELWPGTPFPQGATFDGRGVNFSLYSEHASKVELCLFDRANRESRIELSEVDTHCHHVYLPGLSPGQRYGYRVHGPWNPANGQRFNPHKLLLDPYSKAIDGQVEWGPEVYGYELVPAANGSASASTTNTADSAAMMPRSVVINPYFDWQDDRAPRTPLPDTIIYEAHVRGMTMQHPDVPPELRGTYAGLATEPIIDYLTSLGVTAIELMPVHHFIHDHHLVEKGLRNYWGYQSIGYLAPHGEYAAWGSGGQQVQEFKYLVQTLHAAGIEVILDVVYNHTAEGNHFGPSLSFRGVDNEVYYRLDGNDLTRYVDYTGTGNSLNVRSPHVLRLIMDSLRYWVLEMHVDGFRFDLAAALARELHDVDRLSAFFDIIQQDPVISQVKLIAEPWDIGEGGYQVGNFPTLWSEWNGKYRDNVRGYWKGDYNTLGEFAYRFTGSSDLYARNGRRPVASINFVTAHDGFTMRDLVSYNEKHNTANGESNRDGDSHNSSWNSGVEGPTDDPDIQALRDRRVRSFFTTLLLSQGVPMLLMGDEIGRTQGGNNNGYAQDNAVSWMDWDNADVELAGFVRDLVALREAHPVFRRRRWFEGAEVRDSTEPDIGWYTPEGMLMTPADWNVSFAKALAVALNGHAIPSPDQRGRPIVDDDFLIFFNAGADTQLFTMPTDLGSGWVVEIDTAHPTGHRHESDQVVTDTSIGVADRGVVVLRRPSHLGHPHWPNNAGRQ